jgi:hypothetical protein
MGRTTQFIGLTEAAQSFVTGLKELPSNDTVCGMFDEKLPLRKWEAHDIMPRDRACIREVLQLVYWSAGPMLFTCLELDFGNGFLSQVYEWIHDPLLKNEYDRSTGRLWV